MSNNLYDYDFPVDDYVPDPRPENLPRFKVGDKVVVKADKADLWTNILHHPDRVFTILRIVWQDEGGWDILELDERNDPAIRRAIGQEWLACNESYMVHTGQTFEATIKGHKPTGSWNFAIGGLTIQQHQTNLQVVESYHGRKFR